MRYTGETCSVCHAVFTDDDDIVVCPECGTPHHRKCYLENKDCANAARHAEDFVWTPAVARTAQADPAVADTPAETPPAESLPKSAQPDGHHIVFCPQCGAQNAAEEPVCTECGARLYNMQNQPFSPPIQLPDMSARPFYANGTVIAPTDTLDGNTVGDTAEYVRFHADRYIPKFYALEKSGKKLSWNWAAFLFSPFWFFYRKLYAVGGILLALMLVVTGATMTPRYMQANIEFQEAFLQAAEDGKTFLEAVDAATPAYRAVRQLPEAQIQYYSSVLIHLFSALAANYLYKKKTGKDIAALRAQHPKPQEYRFFLFRRGGTSILMAFASFMILMSGEQILFNIFSGFLL